MKKTVGSLLIAAVTVLMLCHPGWKGGEAVAQRYWTADVAGMENIRMHGAKGDGKTDDTQALLSAIAAAETGRGGNVYLPEGIYRIGSGVTVPYEVELYFDVGGVLCPDRDVKFNIQGSFAAGDHQIFGGEGKIVGMDNDFIGNPMWFGAKGDGKTDDTAAFQKTIDRFDQVEIPFREEGYVVSDLKLNRAGMIFRGAEGKKAKLIASPDTKNLLTVSTSLVDITDLSFEMAAAPQATCVFYDDSTTGIERCNLKRIDAMDAYCVVRDADHPKNMVVTTTFEQILCKDGRGTAFECNDMWGFMFMTDVCVDYSGSAAKHNITVDFPGVYIKDNAGFILTDVQVIGDPNGTEDAAGFLVDPSAAVWFRRCSAENVSGYGMHLKSGSWIYFVDFDARNCGEGGMSISSGFMVQMKNINVSYDQRPKKGTIGVNIRGGSGYQMENLSVKNTSGNGMTVRGATKSTFTNLNAVDCGGYGINGEREGNSFVNVTGSGNTHGDLSLN